MNTEIERVTRRFKALDTALESRSRSDYLRFLHCYVQFRRADPMRSASDKFGKLRRRLENALDKRKYNFLDEELTGLLNAYGWQSSRHRSWCDLEMFESRGFTPETKFVTFDPSASGVGDSEQRLVPYSWKAEPKIVVFPGNRAHLDCIEWQDPKYLNTHTFRFAESYTYRYMRDLVKLVPDEIRSSHRVIGVVPHGCRNRHENRLEHFQAYHSPGWLPPRCTELAETLSNMWVEDIISNRESKSGDGFPVITIGFSMGCTIMEAILRLVETKLKNQLDLPQVRNSLSNSLAIQLGGYMSTNLVPSLIRRLVFTSFLDENVVGSADGIFDLHECRRDLGKSFTSPIRTPENPWRRLDRSEIHKLAFGDFLNIPSAPLISIAKGCQIGLFAGPPAASLDTGASDSSVMASTRFGHTIPPQVEAVRVHYGEAIDATLQSTIWRLGSGG